MVRRPTPTDRTGAPQGARVADINPEQFANGLELIGTLSAELDVLLDDTPEDGFVSGDPLLRILSRLNYVTSTLVSDLLESKFRHIDAERAKTTDSKVQ